MSVRYDRVIDQQVYTYYVNKKTNLIGNWYDESSALLEVGCGTGAYTVSLAKKSKMIVGLDLSSVMIERGLSKARRLGFENTHFVVGDASKLPFCDEAFDLALSVNLLHHIAIKTVVVESLLENVRCCRPGGYVLVFELNPNSLGWSEALVPRAIRNFVFALLYPFRQRVTEYDEVDTRMVNVFDLISQVKKAKIRLRKTGGFIPPYCPKFLFKAFVSLEKIMEASPLSSRYGAHTLVVAEVKSA